MLGNIVMVFARGEAKEQIYKRDGLLESPGIVPAGPGVSE
jgi:hypothetical protein